MLIKCIFKLTCKTTTILLSISWFLMYTSGRRQKFGFQEYISSFRKEGGLQTIDWTLKAMTELHSLTILYCADGSCKLEWMDEWPCPTLIFKRLLIIHTYDFYLMVNSILHITQSIFQSWRWVYNHLCSKRFLITDTKSFKLLYRFEYLQEKIPFSIVQYSESFYQATTLEWECNGCEETGIIK